MGRRYKIGDFVTIRSDLIVYKNYGEWDFISSMKEFCGRKAIVVDYSYDYSYKLDIEGFGLAPFAWTDEMLEVYINAFNVDEKILLQLLNT